MYLLAGDGLTYSQGHTTALCGPTRSYFLNGRNYHQNSFATIAVPVALYLLGGPSAARALDGLRTWLNANNATVMAVLLVIGVVLFGKDLSGLIG